MTYPIDDLREVHGDPGALEVTMIAGVVYKLRHLTEPQLQEEAIRPSQMLPAEVLHSSCHVSTKMRR